MLLDEFGAVECALKNAKKSTKFYCELCAFERWSKSVSARKFNFDAFENVQCRRCDGVNELNLTE